MSGDFGVRLTDEHDALPDQLRLEHREVLDDPVVDHRDPSIAAGMRVRVAVGGAAMGGPAGVPDAGGRRRQRVVRQSLLELRQFPGALRDHQAVWTLQRDAGGVVAPVLQPPQALQDHVHGL